MVELKKYQQKSVDILKDYLKELERVGSKYAFMGITDKPYKSEFFNETPFVCVKIPTGGGKTLVGCHSVVETLIIIIQQIIIHTKGVSKE